MRVSRFAVVCLLPMLGLCLLAADVLAQGPGRGRGGFMPESNIRLLMSEGVQEELDLVEDQVAEIEELNEQMRTEMREMFMGMRDQWQSEDREAMFEKMRNKMKELNDSFDSKTKEILLDHQMDRLQQIRFQSEARRRGGATGGNLPQSLIEKLKITDEQLEELKAKAEEVKKKMEEKMAKLRKQAEEEVLSVLSKEQQEQYKKLMGDTFQFQERGRFGGGDRGRGSERGARGGDRGGRKGDRGGRGGDRARDDF